MDISNAKHIIQAFLLINGIIFTSCSFYIDIEDDGPIVRGGTITFRSTLYQDTDKASGSFRYTWTDNAIPQHSISHESKHPIDSWSITYDKTLFPSGQYNVQVEVCKYFIVCYDITSNRKRFYINETLNGEINLIQSNVTRKNNYVSNAETVVHNISIKATDLNVISTAPNILTYWFVDCVYYGVRRDFVFPFNYTGDDQDHMVEALVVADFTPLPPPITTTTTTSTTTAKPNTTTTTTTATTTPKPTKSTTVKPTTITILKPKVKRETSSKNETKVENRVMVKFNGSLVPYNGTFPYICNGTRVATDVHKTYGYFLKKIKVRAPVSKVNITGNNWLQHGELLTLRVQCEGSKNLKYCINYKKGAYNVTGNETCNQWDRLETCEFTFQRYFGESTEYTIIIIIENEVNKKVTPVAVTVYKVKQQAQLSVIMVPVVFSLVAVVLIIFGVAYYLQNRSRFVVEVADFNFGQSYSDMEYKTFKERLRDSISNAFFSRGPSPGSSEVPVWPPGRKYGSMTS